VNKRKKKRRKGEVSWIEDKKVKSKLDL